MDPAKEDRGQPHNGGFGGYHCEEDSGEEERVRKNSGPLGGDGALNIKLRMREKGTEKAMAVVQLGSGEMGLFGKNGDNTQ